jgi:hypothetical protein
VSRIACTNHGTTLLPTLPTLPTLPVLPVLPVLRLRLLRHPFPSRCLR